MPQSAAGKSVPVRTLFAASGETFDAIYERIVSAATADPASTDGAVVEASAEQPAIGSVVGANLYAAATGTDTTEAGDV
jgi:hypothetical protein